MSGMIRGIFSSPLFTWWNSATIGTRWFTARRGIKVGEDAQGNRYYRDKTGQFRWVIYGSGPVEASRVPPDWHAWLHKTVDQTPLEAPSATKAWEKEHQPNLSGSPAAYAPGGTLLAAGERQKTAADYEAWRPGE